MTALTCGAAEHSMLGSSIEVSVTESEDNMGR